MFAASGKASSGVATGEADWEERESNGELGFNQNVMKSRVRVHLRPWYRQANALHTFAASTVPRRRRIWDWIELSSRMEGGKEGLGSELYRASRGTRGRTLGRLSPASRQLEGRLMASINRSLKAGGVMALNAITRSRLSEEERGETLTSGPHGTVREGGGGRALIGRAYYAARGGEGESTRADRGGAGRATGPRAHYGRGARGERGEKLGQGLGLG